jgi:hypothetical protein
MSKSSFAFLSAAFQFLMTEENWTRFNGEPIDLEYVSKEYELILQKKSKLSYSQREYVINKYKSHIENK